MMIGFLTDPFFKLHIPPGPMAEQAMSMRDPSFYTYHTVIDNLFEKFKQALPPYKVIGVSYLNIEVQVAKKPSRFQLGLIYLGMIGRVPIALEGY